MIRIEHLTKRYEDTTVLNIAEMDIPKGQFWTCGKQQGRKNNAV